VHTIKSLCQRFGLSERAIRRRLDALSPLLSPHLRRGDKNSLLLSNSGVAILDRLNQLQQDADLGLNSAVDKVKSELQDGRRIGYEQGANSADYPSDALVASLEARVKEQAQMIGFLQDQLEGAQSQLRAMLPASTSTRQRLGRWGALKVLVTGRV